MPPTAIAGVASEKEAVITSVWPSIASTPVGRLIGMLNECIPLRINGIKLSALIFGLPLAPLGLLEYLRLKVMGRKYVLTNKSLQVWATLGAQQLKSVPLADIKELRMYSRNGQEFFHAAEIELIGADGGVLLRMHGIGYPETFQHNLEEAQQAAALTAASLQTIKARSK